MCGIFGVYGHYNFEYCINHIEDILSTLNRRGPDKKDFFHNHDLKILLGHTRLSILELSKYGSQPMLSTSKEFTISFNGEIYNHDILRDDLKQKNLIYFGNSDTRSLIEHIYNFGISNTLNKIRGMFAFAIYNSVNDNIILARDAFGEKPLYYLIQNNTLYFSSTLEAFKKIRNIKLEIDKSALNTFLKRGYIPYSETIYKNVYKVEKGSFIKFQLDRNSKTLKQDTTFWFNNNEIKNQNKHSIKENIDKIEELITKSVKQQLVADVPVGVLLSGGIDSSVISTIASKVANKKINTFTIGFNDTKYDESSNAQKVARHLNTNHENYILNEKDALDMISDIPSAYSEPFADSSQIPQLLISKYVRKKVKVVLSGDGGDELFGGYNRYIYIQLLWNIFFNLPKNLRNPIFKLLKLNSEKNWDLVNTYLLKYIYPGKISFLGNKVHKFSSAALNSNNPLDLYNNINSIWEEPNLITNTIQKPNLDRIIYNKNQSIMENFMQLDLNEYLPDDILCKVDRASMFHSLESRAPFLNLDILNYVKTISIDQKIKKNNGKVLLRKILEKYLPTELMNYPKQGFSLPLADWMRGSLKEIIYDHLNKKNIIEDGNFKYSSIKKIIDEHMMSKYNHEKKIWCIFNYFFWKNNLN